MKFIKCGKNYVIKGSNGYIVSEEEKIKLENKELVLKDIEGCECQKETTKKISKNKKRLKELEDSLPKREKITTAEATRNLEEFGKKINTALKDKGESADDSIEETVKSI